MSKASSFPKSLFSQSWYRVAEIKPRLRGHVQFHHHVYRGCDWYVLQEHSSGQFHRFSKEAYLLIGMMNGDRTMAEIWEATCEKLKDDMATQDEVISLLSYLHQSDILQSDVPPDIADLGRRNKKERRQKWIVRIASPAAMNFGLWDPDALLTRTSFFARWLFSLAAAVLWCLIVSIAMALLVLHWSELSSNLADRVLSTENLLLLALIYPVSRFFHELTHAYAVKRWGGEVHEIGVMFIVFFPLPYVDASWASAFPSRWKRMVVGASGIMADVFLASLSMIVWVFLEPGISRALAFNVLFICGLSTLLLNGNPLVRFDAYYVLADWLEIPNLGDRANQFVSYVAKRHLLRMDTPPPEKYASGEKTWMVIYSFLSFLYRIFIAFEIIFFIAGRFFIVGILLAIWSGISILLVPPIRFFRQTMNEISGMRKKNRLIALWVSVACLAVLAFVFLWPFPSYTLTEGVVAAHEKGRVFSGVNGFVVKVLTPSGTHVKKGDPLLYCNSPDLQARIRVLAASLNEARVRLRACMAANPLGVGVRVVRDEIEDARAKLARAREQASRMVVRSPTSGVFVLPEAEDWPGRYVRKGSPVGYVVDFSKVVVSVIVNQSDIDRMLHDTKKVEVRFSESPGKVFPARILWEVPEASREIPSLALSVEGGGPVAIDPEKAHSAKPRAFEKLFHIQIGVKGAMVRGIGERVYVRLVYGNQSLSRGMYRFFRRLFLKRLHV